MSVTLADQGESMRARGIRTTIVTATGLVAIGALAGCSGVHTQTVSLSKQEGKTSTAMPRPVGTPTPAASVSPTPTATPAATPKPAAKTPTAPVKVAAPAPKPKPKRKPKPPVTVTYADGTYTENGIYKSPGGTETIKVKLTLASGLVQSVTVSTVFADPEAQGYENQFIAGISAVVVGKPIATLSVGAVGGSSLTGQGFNQAVASIRADAKQ